MTYNPKFPYRKVVNGVLVESERPFVPERWWDNPALHLIFSYSSWGTLIVRARFGWEKPREIHDRVFDRDKAGF